MGKRALGAWIGVPLLLLGLAGGGLAWLAKSFDPCENEMLDSLSSPDGRWIAAAYLRNCGATTRFSVNVSLLPAGGEPEGPGNVFSAYGTDASLAWDADALTIGYDESERVFRRETHYGEVAVRYAGFSPQASPISR